MSKSTCCIEVCGDKVYVRGYCRPHYRRLMKYGDPNGAPAPRPEKFCEVVGCANIARSKSSPVCAKHYHRAYRHGSVEADMRKVVTGHQSRYVTKYLPGHPAASKSGRIYVHRMIVFDRLGGMGAPCHWCGTDLTWFRPKGAADDLCVDHLNGDRADNRPENLVTACNRCNSGRAAQDRSKILAAEYGAWSVNDTVASLRSELRRRRPPIVII